MKLLLSTLLLISIAFGSAKEVTENTESPLITYEKFDTPAAFSFGENVYLDIDHDGTDDFQFSTVIVNDEGTIRTKYIVNALGKNQLLAVDGSAAFSDEGEAIREFGNEHWTNASGEIIEQVIHGSNIQWSGTWSGDREQYVGIKLVQDDKSFMGWVSVSVDPVHETAFVHGYGMNQTPNGTISAGQQ